MAREGDLPGNVAALLPARGTPWIAALLTFAASTLLLPVGQIGLLAGLSSFAALLAFLAVNTALIVLRARYPDHHRPFRTPFRIGALPLLPVAAIALILVLMMYFEPAVYAGGAIAIAVSIVLFLAMARTRSEKG